MDRLAAYHEYREAGKALHSRMLEATTSKEAIRETAALLGLVGEDGRLVYDGEMDMNVHQEYLLFEHASQGQTAVEQFHRAEGWESQAERTVLEAMKRSETSFFRVSAVEESARRLVLEDRLTDDDDLGLTDLSLSQSIDAGVLLFMRRLPFESLAMTSGVIFPFVGHFEDHLISVYDGVRERVTDPPTSATRFLTFYRMHRKYGAPIQSRETGPGPDETATLLSDRL